MFNGQLGECLPVGFYFRCNFEGFQDLYSLLKSLILKGSTKFDECLFKLVGVGIHSGVNDDFGFTFGTLDGFYVTLDVVHGYLVGLFDGVPDAEVLTVLSYHNVGVRNPRDILAIVKKSLLFLLFDVIEMKLASLVSEKELGTTRVQLEVV